MTMASPIPVPMPLAALARRARATVAAIDWHMLTPAEVRRLREFGLDEGVEIEMLQRAGVGGGPLACRIGRMAITFRSHIARAIHVTL
ncbi:ferrous iron transport protein A [Sphingomonas donggukensis]|uniref:Ferrous iron transport protein A n=1 Tax=Sphingomonas donggukensis TaxID=2949093 RepID=A0ABY4TU26_9SPHN|nr:FeoA family protein [Sphingomonas donggukensis]URW75211.1 ferrous iron transport protein A [Sphingomonas donggukensis]